MSLMQLLAVSRSFDSEKNESTRYKMTGENLLPKFAPAKRPLRLTPAAARAMRVQPSLATAPVSAGVKPVRESDTGGLFEGSTRVVANRGETVSAGGSQPGPAPAKQPEPAKVSHGELFERASKPGSRKRKPVPGRSWWRKLLGRLGIRNPFAPRNQVRPLELRGQTEFSLEGVKVVRNDLNEADLEVVPAGGWSSVAMDRKAGPAVSGANGERRAGGVIGPAWSRITARFLEGDHLRI
jgi:hypothetical protein